MSKVESLNDIDELIVHWSESEHINKVLGHNEDYDIEKKVDVFSFDKMVQVASNYVEGGYDKTSLTVKLKDGAFLAKECKFYLGRNDTGLLDLLNRI